MKKGDRVTIYMPMVPEVAIAMLACARIGAPHSVIFGGFAPEAVRDRIHDAESTVLITADGGCRRGGIVPLKKNVDEALQECPDVSTVIVLKRTGQEIAMQAGRDIWWDDFVKDAPAYCAAEPMDAEDMLYLLYTSGSTGKPKGIVHTTGGYLTGVYATTKWVFDLQDTDVYWCTADIGWVTGHSYVVYGPLANGATTVMYEGTPDFPDKDRFWRIVEKHGVTIFYTAPTAIRTFMRWGEEYPEAVRPVEPAPAREGRRADQSRGLGLVLEGHRRRPLPGRRHLVADGDGAHPHHPAAGHHHAQAGLGHPAVPRHRGGGGRRPGQAAKAGYLVLKKPWPGMLRGIYGDPSASWTSTGAGTRGSTSPATAPSATRTATSGSWGAWTT